MGNYIGIAVHGYRNPDNSSEETVTRVVATGNHCYDGNQHEMAIKASTNRHRRPRWYIGYGGDYIPANKADIKNIVY